MTRLRGNPWAVLISLCLGFFMILLDTTIVNVAIPGMMRGLGASLDEVLWVVNAYTLVYAVLLITGGRLGDIVGRRTLFLLGMAVFTLASIACGLSQNATELIAARAAQGVGGALLTPQTLSTVTVIFPPEKRGAAFGVWGAVAGSAAVAGPVLGGLLVTSLGWRWIFFVNVPVCAISIALALLVFPDTQERRPHRIDVLGVVLSTAGLVGTAFALIEGQHYGWGTVRGWVTIPMIAGAGVVLLAVFLLWQHVARDHEPLIPLGIFRTRDFAVMNLVGVALQFGLLGLFLPLTLFLQSVLGLSALDAGLTAAPMSVISLLISPLTGRLAGKRHGALLLMAGMALFGAGTVLIDVLARADVGRWSLLPGLLVGGVGMGCVFAPLQTVAMRGIPPRLAGAASGVINTSRQLGAVLGSAAVGALLQDRLAAALSDAGHGPHAYADAFATALHPTLVLPAAVVLVGALCCLAATGRAPNPAAQAEAPAPASESAPVITILHDGGLAGRLVAESAAERLGVPLLDLTAGADGLAGVLEKALREDARARGALMQALLHPGPVRSLREHVLDIATLDGAVILAHRDGETPAMPESGAALEVRTGR